MENKEPGSGNKPPEREENIGATFESKQCSQVKRGMPVLLQVIPVTVHGPNGYLNTHAMLDSGSTCSLVLSSVAEKLGLEGSEERIILNGIQGTSELNSRRVNTQVSAVNMVTPRFDVNGALVVEHLNIAQQKVNLVDVKSKWPHLKEIDIPEASSCDVSLLIGSDCLDIILPIATRCGPRGTPVGIRTKLGWTITGPLPGYIRTSEGIFHTYVRSPDEELHNQVKLWWRTEEFGCKYDVETQRSVEDENAMRILEETTKKVDGRYEVPLLWKNGGSMQNNRTVAEHRLALLERRLQRDPNLAEAYKETIHRDLEKGYVKRIVLNEAPFLVRAKILLQRVWQLGLAWDDILPQDLLEEWQLWEAELLMIREFSVPRFYRQVDEYPGDIEVHIFGDASELAFCSVGFLRFKYADGSVNTTVLHWIRGTSTRHPSFIANRLSEILDATEASQWHYCPSKLNPADDGTRGLPVLSITTSNRWLTGPEFLLLDESQWPEDVTNRVVNDNIPDVVTESDVQFTGKVTTQSEPEELVNLARYSSYSRALTVMVYVQRLLRNCKVPVSERTFGSPLVEELEKAKKTLIRQEQIKTFTSEFRELKRGRPVHKQSKLVSLTPFLDEDDIIRVGGRIGKAAIPFVTRHPIVLDSSGDLTKLIVMDTHNKLGHAGVDNVRNELRQQFWILRCKATKNY
ncbi:Hypothetical predicted protein [Paramuricea clavata]|uniref:Uncharacterized protein n=1 Tax=Paramuricea clavata TaxID=317549 RepID=A0A7D9DU78_PARCT|nr:Hypothetical predicted protein [Paramuricea clavata]